MMPNRLFLISLGEDVCLKKPAKVADYLRSAFEENPMQEAFYCIYLDRKNHPRGRQLINGWHCHFDIGFKKVLLGDILSVRPPFSYAFKDRTFFLFPGDGPAAADRRAPPNR